MRYPSIEAFAAQRRTDQADMEKNLFPIVAEAVKTYPAQGWYDALLKEVARLYTDTYHREGGKGIPKQIDQFLRDVRDNLDKTSEPNDTTADRLSIWLATAILNAATMEAAGTDEEFLVMEWVTMHDDDVRLPHKHTEGQQRPPGEPFDVDGTEMRYPGDPTAPIEFWINCRCSLAPTVPNQFQALTAASSNPDAGACIVALPPASDPTQPLYAADKAKPGEQLQPQEGHLTLAWLGKPDENPNLDVAAVADAVKKVAAGQVGFAANVTGVDMLGEDGALVWFLDPEFPVDLRTALMAEPVISDAVAAVKQHPTYTPHVTIGYDVPLSGDGMDALSAIEEISFDRVAVWNGDDHYEYDLGNLEADVTAPADIMGPTPFHAVLAPEGKWSGDGRSFAPGSLTFRDLPLPLSWQKVSSAGHDGSVVVCKAEQIARVDGEMRATGHFLMIPEADEVIGLVAEFGKFGISVDADDAEFDFDEATGRVEFTRARIASASIVTIPAFAEAYISLGDAPPGFMPGDQTQGDVCNPDDPAYDETACAQKDAQPVAQRAMATSLALMDMARRVVGIEMVSEGAWDGSASRFTDQQWKRSCVLHLADTLNKSDHKLPIREPGGALSRAGTHAAAARFNQVQAPSDAKARAKASLRGAYKELGEEPPDVLKAADSTLDFARGPGWLTNPEDTKRLHDYWTKPGEPGYVKIGWGVPGDFNRCRTLVGQEIAENSPDTVRFLNQICAQWHHDALGIWPGEHHSLDAAPPEGTPSPAVSLVAAGGWCAPSDWFKNPELKDLTPLTITEEGQVYGHIAGWNLCHAAFKMCVAPPHSVTGYAHFLTGAVLLDDGTQVPVGPITYGGGHAGPGGMRAAMAHYDDASTVVCDVTCGEDEHGIWVAGWTRPGVDPAKVVGLRASPPSGDWRRDRKHDHLSDTGKAMEMIVVHSVNDPGYLIPRVGVENGEQVSLVAAGYVGIPDHEGHDWSETRQEIVEAVIEELTERSRRKQQMAEVAARIGD